ncbi:MAG: peptidase C39 family protein [Candidatus Micrarchaeaceae archaeon]
MAKRIIKKKSTSARRTIRSEKKAGAKPSVAKRKSKSAVGNSIINKMKRAKLKDKVLLDMPHYPQTEDFTSAAACAMMVLKSLNKNFRMRRENEYSIWQEAVSGSVWYGSKYGLAYALAKRGADVAIVSNTQDEGYERRMAVYENVNLDALDASFNEIKQKSQNMGIEEEYVPTVNVLSIKKALSSNHIPIVLIDVKTIDSYLDSMPHWVVVKGYDKDNFYISDPYSDSTITLDFQSFKNALGFENNFHMILVRNK